MKTDKVTREDLRSMAMGETKVFTLPSAQACDTGKTVAYQLQNILGCKFTLSTDYATNSLTITKSAV